jgi:putative methanogenesis marker 16 metalloprotein
MISHEKTISEINSKLKDGKAVVMTAMELKARVRSGESFTPADVDVVTTATRAVMSGTSAMLSLPVGENGTRPDELIINGVPCLAGFITKDGFTPVIINGTEESLDNHGRYGGGHVLREIIERKPVEVVWRKNGQQFRRNVVLDEMPFARIYASRNAYQNYMSFTNVKNADSYRNNPTSIFTCRPIPPLAGLTVCGTGEVNPAENDTGHVVLRPGIRILVNGAVGTLIGYGTRASADQTCYATAADMCDMDPQYIGGFRTSFGVEVCSSLAVPFPIINQDVLDRIMRCRDEHVMNKIGDLADRLKIMEIEYAQIWHDAPLEVQFDKNRCISCSFQCEAEYYCPMGAISWKDKTIDQDLCVACGACTANCPGGAFMGKGWKPHRGLGDIEVFGKSIPIIFRLSNRLRANRLARQLKDMLDSGSFSLVDTKDECILWNC